MGVGALVMIVGTWRQVLALGWPSFLASALVSIPCIRWRKRTHAEV